MSDRRRAITVQSTVRDMLGREGLVLQLVTVNGLPGAVVEFPQGTEAIPLGYLEWAASSAGMAT